MRRMLVTALLCTFLLAAVPNATAISGGTPDGSAHPNVGALVMRADGELFRLCSGVLIAPTAFLTHAFCIGDVANVLENGGEVAVTFDDVVDANSTFHPVSMSFVHPDAHWSSFRNMYGIAVVTAPVGGIAPAELPAPGVLDSLEPTDALTVVGYGEAADCSGPGRCINSHDQARRQADVEVAGLSPDVLVLQINPAATGEGGTCRGDNGAPVFLGETNVVVAVAAAAAGGQCHAVTFAFRNDTSLARSFLDDFLP